MIIFLILAGILPLTFVAMVSAASVCASLYMCGFVMHTREACPCHVGMAAAVQPWHVPHKHACVCHTSACVHAHD